MMITSYNLRQTQHRLIFFVVNLPYQVSNLGYGHTIHAEVNR